MYHGPIIDTHHHLWEVANYPWLTAPPSEQRQFFHDTAARFYSI